MLEGKKTKKQVAGLLEQRNSAIFSNARYFDDGRGHGIHFVGKDHTRPLRRPDIPGFFKVTDPVAALKKDRRPELEIKKRTHRAGGTSYAACPKLTFYIDDTLEYMDKMEQLFKEIKKRKRILVYGSLFMSETESNVP